ncbi:glutamine--fructose-6-phosphate transaminase (isomerizing) [Patescibacteria group bacterium]|nr:glutamine--fructose-6-phosphate transaminase (isomerizing) [Patescibacteria group bacterium]MBP9709976.1 glutamine--fructose-6-phosphate transaminase (isomerizing) [Patescibacteria group bacterium]
MCGIVAYVGSGKTTAVILDGLRRLEYRGYDSAGIALISEGKMHRERAVGPINALEPKTLNLPKATIGIGHTRWATHGPPTESNAHPHADCQQGLAVVHNGIIENYAELKTLLENEGHTFVSETDTEVLAHLIEREKSRQSEKGLYPAVIAALRHVHGTYGLAVIDQEYPDELVVARLGSPMAIGIGNNEYIIASDPSAILSYTRQVIFLDDHEVAVLNSEGLRIHSLKSSSPIQKSAETLEWSLEDVQKNGQPHFMLKEILEEPEVLRNTMRGRLFKSEGNVKLGGLKDVAEELKTIERIILVGCGTAYYAGCIGKYLLETWAGISTDVEIASEFRYRNPVIGTRTAIIAISQSGETADTLAALREGKMKGALPLGIVNVVGSTIARETQAGIYTHAGPELGVASTKAFISQCTTLAMLSVLLGRSRNLSHSQGTEIITALEGLPEAVSTILEQRELIMEIAKKYALATNMLFLGRTFHAPIAYEGALKVKEVSYIHAEGYPAGEIKHGPLALVDENLPCIVLCPKDSVFQKTLSNIQEIRARGGRVLAITTEDGKDQVSAQANDVIVVPKTLEPLQPILSVIPLQLMAYTIAVAKGYNPDRPRNLAKSVTVE